MQTTLFEVSEPAPAPCFKNATTGTQNSSRFGDNFLHEQMGKSKAVAICDVKPYARALRKHPERQITAMMGNLASFGQVAPILLAGDNTIIDGHLIVEGLKRHGAEKVWAVYVDHLPESGIKALRLALNKLSQATEWDMDILTIELVEVIEADYSLEIVGSSTIEFDRLSAGQAEPESEPTLPDDYKPVTRLGDVWHLGNHRLICGNATKPETYNALLRSDHVRMVFTDPPYNVKINGHVKRGDQPHREFVQGSGELTDSEHTTLLRAPKVGYLPFLVDGAIVYECIDAPHIAQMLASAEGLLTYKQLCVWTKDRAGMGSFYRSQHELVFVFKYGDAQHINNFKLGENGRMRSNVWQYPAVRTDKPSKDNPSSHPTPKPVAMVADAIMDCSKLNDIVLDPFGGSGTTLIAADRTRRQARIIELDPIYCDLTILRWQKATRAQAKLADGQTFDEERETRSPDAAQGESHE